jgi:K+ transport systems, NAD-binding component
MRYLIIGVGNFGKSLAVQLTNYGNEVIVVDNNPLQIEYIKDKVAGAYIFDATETFALSSLPLKEIDVAIVAIGKNMSASLRTVVILKNLKVKVIYARAFDEIQESVLKAIGDINILTPEVEAAKMYANQFSNKE